MAYRRRPKISAALKGRRAPTPAPAGARLITEWRVSETSDPIDFQRVLNLIEQDGSEVFAILPAVFEPDGMAFYIVSRKKDLAF
jgi:hypothetical protein